MQATHDPIELFGNFPVNEWIGPDEITTVNISFGSDKYALYVKGLDGVATRSVNLAVYEVVTLFIYPNYPYVVLIEIPKAYDLVSKL